MTLDTTSLARTSEKQSLHWRETSLTFIWIRTDGPITVAHTIADKCALLADARDDDDVLAVRQVRYPTREEVMIVDDRDAARHALLSSP